MDSKAKAILYSSLTLRDLFTLLIKGDDDCDVFWDPYRDDLTCLQILLVFFFGRSKAAKLISLLGALLGLRVKDVPHGISVQDYHRIQIMSENETTELLEGYLNNHDFEVDSCSAEFVQDNDCQSALHIKRIGLLLGPIIENIKVLKAIGYEEIILVISINAFPESLVKNISENYEVHIQPEKKTTNITNLFLLSGFCIQKILSLFARIIKRPRNVLRAKDFSKCIAVEFVDPNNANGNPTEPNYYDSLSNGEYRTISYVRSMELRNNGPRKKFLDSGLDVVFLCDLPLDFRDVKNFVRLMKSLLKRNLGGRYSIKKSLRDLDDVINLIELQAFMRIFKPSLHSYHILPNGNTTTRFDSPLITDVCRMYKCKSISYQSRVMYRKKMYYYFEVFDVFFFWGQLWLEEYSHPQFIVDSRILGFLGKCSEPERDYEKGEKKSVAIFTSDLDKYHPQHYTLDYTKMFLSDVFSALSDWNNSNHVIQYKAILKPKDPSHWSIIQGLFEQSGFLSGLNLVIEVNQHERHDLDRTISMADRVISIGYTTPGLLALFSGKHSLFYSPYIDIYNEIFDSHASGIVGHSKLDVVDFLDGKTKVTNKIKEGLLGKPSLDAQKEIISAIVELVS